MRHNIYCSTGCLLSRANGRDWRLLKKWCPDVECDGFEFLLLDTFNGRLGEIAAELSDTGIVFPTVHLDKDIGTLLSDGLTDKAFDIFCRECEFARKIGAKIAVLHLWGGLTSDSMFAERNIKTCGRLISEAEKSGLTIAIENVPCSSSDPLSHWAAVRESYPGLRYIFDTRFAALHGQLYDFAASETVDDGSVIHMHISDFAGPRMSFRALRPILHPGEGIIDFPRYFRLIKGRYAGSVTLESPVIALDGSVDLNKLNRTLRYIRDNLDD